MYCSFKRLLKNTEFIDAAYSGGDRGDKGDEGDSDKTAAATTTATPTEQQQLHIRVLSGTDGSEHVSPKHSRSLLLKHLVMPVRMDRMAQRIAGE